MFDVDNPTTSHRPCQPPAGVPAHRQVTVVALLTAPAGDQPALGARLRRAVPDAGTSTQARLCPHHFPHQHDLRPHERRLLVAARAGRCAGGPIGLLDLAALDAHATAAAAVLHQRWEQVVAGTPPARPWQTYLTRHQADPHGYPMPAANTAFTDQPRIAAMLTHDLAGTDPLDEFAVDEYGPGLLAHQTGAAAYAHYLRGLALCGDALITADGQALSATDDPVGFAGAARARILRADPATVAVAAHLYP